MWIRFLPALSKYKRWIKKIISNYDEHICWFETRSIFMNSFFSVVEFPRISDKRYCNGANLIYFIFAKLNFSRAMMTERRTIAQSNLKEEIDKCHAFAMLWTSRYYPDRCCKKLAIHSQTRNSSPPLASLLNQWNVIHANAALQTHIQNYSKTFFFHAFTNMLTAQPFKNIYDKSSVNLSLIHHNQWAFEKNIVMTSKSRKRR